MVSVTFNPVTHRADALRLLEQRHWTAEEMATELDLTAGQARKVLTGLHDSKLVIFYKAERAYGMPGGHSGWVRRP